jgi:hypothetical protein
VRFAKMPPDGTGQDYINSKNWLDHIGCREKGWTQFLIHIQKFTNGYMFGVIPTRSPKDNPTNEGVIVILSGESDGKHKSHTITVYEKVLGTEDY